MLAAVWLTVLLVRAAPYDTGWLWAAYGVALAASIALDVYLALLVAAHLVLVVVSRCARTVLLRFAIAAAVAVCAMAPFLVTVAAQAHQISWIAPIGRRTLEDVVVQQYFERSPPFAALSALLIAAAIALWLSKSVPLPRNDGELLALASAWLVLPTAAILAYSALVHSIYTPATCRSPCREWR